MNSVDEGRLKGFTMTAGLSDHHPDTRAWVSKDVCARSRGLQTQLLFNLAMPSSVHNRASSVGPPAPIVIEKLVPHSSKQDESGSCDGSLRLSVLSEERLQAAVRLAKRDVYRKRQDSITSQLRRSEERSTSPDWNSTANHQSGVSPKGEQRTRSPKRQMKSCSEVLVYTPQKLSVAPLPDHGRSPPTRDPGPRGEPQLSREIHKLQKQLATYIQRIERLADKGRAQEATVEPEERRKLEIRRQEQTARSSRLIYVLQQQVKEIQEDLDKMRLQSVRDPKKSRAVDRLAAAHRGAVRAMQVFIKQLSDPAESRVPAQCRELGQLIRQLSLCSARVDVDQGSAVPHTALDILQTLETLDSMLSKKEGVQGTEAGPRGSSPGRERSPRARDLSRSSPHAPRIPTVKDPRKPGKPAPSKKTFPGRRTAGRPHRRPQLSDQERGTVMGAGAQGLAHLGEGGGGRESRPEPHSHSPATAASRPARSKQGGPVRDVGFQQATVSSRLREGHLPQREARVPWVPTSPHSSTKQQAVSSRPEPRCLFSPAKSSSQPVGGQVSQARGRSSAQQETAAHSWTQAHHEALRMTEDRLKQLNQLTQEETERINRLRTELLSPSQWAQRAEEAARERLQPLLDLAQKDQEEVRRRFATISYTDSWHWEQVPGAQRKSDGSRPASPQPIRLTKAVVKPSTTGDIVIQKPVESSRASESSSPLYEEASAPVRSRPPPSQAGPAGGVRLSVPPSVLKSIQEYREAHGSYLRLVSHQRVGSFDPWAVAESLAEELMTEALSDVAAEFQDVCEQYAEAIFTSEFLQPVQSPPPAVS
ncbi:protein moonraker-like isoform X3 [Brachyhypopomus gauderio]|uniref:protein moonraker-like isoform X3 n=1 Tax=Brachyhypopomus gauderio TaxID=698409 RepID=UPI004041EF0C